MMQVRPENVSTVAEEHATATRGIDLSTAYPNPFRYEARLTVMLDRSEPARVSVFDVLGREVRVLHDGMLAARTLHQFAVSAEGLASGVYVVRVATPTLRQSRRVIIQR